MDGKLVELKEVGTNLKILDELKEGVWYEIKYDADGNVRKVDASNITGINNYTGIPFAAGTKFVPEVANVQAAVNNFDTVLLFDNGNRDTINNTADDITALTYKNGTLYTNTDATKGFSVSPNVQVVLALADKDGDPFDDVDDSYTGYAGLEKALKDMNANHEGFTAGRIELSAILKSGAATVIIINDKTPDGSVDIGDSTVNLEYKPVITQNGTVLNIKANTDDPDGMEVYLGAWNWLVDNGYSVVSADKSSGVWSFMVTKNGNATYFTTNLTPMIKVVVDGTTKSFTWNGDYFAYSRDNWATTGYFNSPYKFNYTNDNGKLLIKTGYYLLTVDSNGSTGGGTVNHYYKIGDALDLDGKWYTSDATPTTSSVFTSTTGTMTKNMANTTIYDNYYKVTVSLAGKTETHYVLSGDDATFTTATFANNQYLYDAKNNTYVEITTANEISNVSSDMDIIDSGFYKVKSVLTVTGAPTGMRLSGDVVGNQYIKQGETVTVKLTLNANGATAGGSDLKGTVSVDNSAVVTATPNNTATIIKANGSTLEYSEITVTLTTAPTGAADVTLTLALA